MDFLRELFTGSSVAHAILVFAMIVAGGLALGSIRVRGISLGVAGVLFSGLAFGHFKITVGHEIMEFMRDFGIILFVYAVGTQVGRGFFSSFKRDGLALNLMAASVVVLGALIVVLLVKIAGISPAAAVGMYSGSVTNTPSLAAAQQAFLEIPNLSSEMLKLPGLGYAAAYPVGVVSIILSLFVLRILFRVDPAAEAVRFQEAHEKPGAKMLYMDLRVENANLEGHAVSQLPALAESGLVVSRIVHGGQAQVAMPDSVIHRGDVIRVVGPAEKLKEFRIIVGSEVKLDLALAGAQITTRSLIVTRREVVGKTVEELEPYLYGVALTRIQRSGVELPASGDVEIQYADTVTVVGEAEALNRFGRIVGDSAKELNHPQLVPVFLGIALGVIAGSIPFSLPGMPAPVRLGLAGGPLVVAILLTRLGRIGPVIWYMPASANALLREIGIALFLACVGLKSGDRFVEVILQGPGLIWMAGAAVVALVPIFTVAFVARFKYRMNFLTLCGLIAGSMTDPPALAFAGQMTPSNAPMVSYAAVYPLVMVLRIISSQILVMILIR